jgi:hypothetical protein
MDSGDPVLPESCKITIIIAGLKAGILALNIQALTFCGKS